MKTSDLVVGAIVQVKNLDTDAGLWVHQKHLVHRQRGVRGRVESFILRDEDPYTVVFVEHGKGISAYRNTELELIGVPI